MTNPDLQDELFRARMARLTVDEKRGDVIIATEYLIEVTERFIGDAGLGELNLGKMRQVREAAVTLAKLTGGER